MNPSAIILPMPRDPPVISATRPLSENRSRVFMAMPRDACDYLGRYSSSRRIGASHWLPFPRPSLMTQRQKSGSRLRHRLMFQVVRADLAIDAAVGQPFDRNQLRRHLRQQVGYVSATFAVRDQREAQLHMAHLPHGAEGIAQAFARGAARSLVEKRGDQR